MTATSTTTASDTGGADSEWLARKRMHPDAGPRILFFSGGTALRETSQALVGYTHNSVHLITPFDSGGSSAILRRHFDMPAVGDLRNRLMALADRTQHGFSEVYDHFTYRLSRSASPAQLRVELKSLVGGGHPLISKVSEPMRKVVCHHLQFFEKLAGSDFDLRGASVGNLILAAGYLENGRRMDPIVSIYSRLVQVRGDVRLLINADLQLKAQLEGGGHVIGQHLITGKEFPPLTRAVSELSLVDPAKGNTPVRPVTGNKVRAIIAESDLICYPVGSFYTSVVANLLPAGVGTAVSRASCPKVFVPNTFPDPESIGMSLASQVRTLLRHLRADDPDAITVSDVLGVVLMDPNIVYPGSCNTERELASLGIEVVRAPLTVRETGAIDPHLLCRVLMSLA